MHPVLIKIGAVTVYSWGFMLAVAVIVGIIGARNLIRKEGWDEDLAFDLVLVMVVAGLVGARLLYVSIYERELFLKPLLMFMPGSNGFAGLVWYGGLLGGLLGLVIYVWKKQLPFWKLGDIFSPFAALGYALVRIGCFLAGCCYGKVCISVPGVVFPLVDDLPRHPTQLYSSGINLLFFFFLLWFYPRKKFPGQVFLLYLLLYSSYRFIMEFFRANLVMYGPFSTSQTYSLVLFALAAVLYYLQFRKHGKVKE
ncbi:MAG: prolipoprotein diacylglyceryl transferase [Syntrophomonas sp.]|uniref:prolipoprotein diacylglyceryl transferase n=1 Tax=Syntrophomonas sp. TaxID=2053627 RepID=UPI002613F619|nr:prolipoprotein diacylglyceryl transferase [Syntrophomonas sp.]MDD2509813.1 prolipoprotein diacylglyceryl transferase [Syntrophomonas sp.]MDD3879959.1 prolipoprotein diacylglyceryl transferase [Syntrophomonas sp.]MDD4625627.1 prolipoprotein diacylglyceryl transferase [Syntrophomonas sp.]